MFRTDHTESQYKFFFRRAFMLFLVLSVCGGAWADATWNGSEDTDWSNQNNWTGALSGTVTIPAGRENYPVLTESVSYPDATLVIESGASLGLDSSTLSVLHVKNDGAINLGVGTLALSGKWTNSGTLSGNRDGAVEFVDPDSVSTVSGDTYWINFKCITPGKKIVIESGSFQKIRYEFEIEGESGNPVEISSSVSSSSFYLYVPSRNSFYCSYAKFSDCKSAKESDKNTINDYSGVLGPGCIDAGNNSGLFATVYVWGGTNSVRWEERLNWKVENASGGTSSTNAAPDLENRALTIKIANRSNKAINLPDTVSVKELIVESGSSLVIGTQKVTVETKVENNGTLEIGTGGSLTARDFDNKGSLVLSSGASASLSVTGTKTNGLFSEVRYKGSVEKLEDFVGLWGRKYEKLTFDSLTYFKELKDTDESDPGKLWYKNISPELAFEDMTISGSLTGSEGLSLTIKSKGSSGTSGLKFKELEISGLSDNESVSGSGIVASGTPVNKITFSSALSTQTFILKSNALQGSVLNLTFSIPGIGTVGTFDSRVFTEWLGTKDNKWNENENWTSGAPEAITTYAIIKGGRDNYPVLNSPLNLTGLNLTVEADGKIDFNGQNVSLKSIANSGTLCLSGTETVTVSGSRTNNPGSTVEYNTGNDPATVLTSLCLGFDYENLTLSGSGTVKIASPDPADPVSYVIRKTFSVAENTKVNIGLTTVKAERVSNAGTITIAERNEGQELKAIETGFLDNSGTVSVGKLAQVVSPSVNSTVLENKGLIEIEADGQLHGYSAVKNLTGGCIHFKAGGTFHCTTFENRGSFLSEGPTSFGSLTNGIRNYGSFELCGKELSLRGAGKPKYNEPGSKITYTQRITSQTMLTWGDSYENLALNAGIEFFSGWDSIRCTNRDLDIGFALPSMENHTVENLTIWKDKNFDVTVTTNAADQFFGKLVLKLESGRGKLSDLEVAGIDSDTLTYNSSTGEIVFSSFASSHSFRLTVKDSTADDLKMTFSVKGFKEDKNRVMSINYGHEMPTITQCHAVAGSDKLSVFFSIPVNGSLSETVNWTKAFIIRRGDADSELQIDESVPASAIRQKNDRNKVMGITFTLNGPVTFEALEKDKVCVNPSFPEGIKSTAGVPLMLDQKHVLSDFASGLVKVETAYANQSMTGPVRVFDGTSVDKVPAGSDISIKVDKDGSFASWDSGLELVMVFGTYSSESSSWRNLVKGFYEEADIDDSSDSRSRGKYAEIMNELKQAETDGKTLEADDENMIFASLAFCQSVGWTGGKKTQFVFAWKKSDGSLVTNADGKPLYCLAVFGQEDVADPVCDVWTFDIGQMKQQDQGVTILNNVLNLNRSDVATLNLEVETAGMVTVQVMTIDGDIVKTLHRGRLGKGSYDFDWDGKNASGRTVARGMYFVRVVGPDMEQTRKIMVVK